MKQQQQPDTGDQKLVHDEAQSQYELRIGGQLAAKAQYSDEGRMRRFTHTEVDSAYEGQGLGSKLASYALDDTRSSGLKAIPQCRFIAGYIARHEKEYADLVAR